MKNKETLEEAAERIFKTHSSNTSLAEDNYDYMMDKEDFKEASLEITKWQQKRSEEEIIWALLLCSNKKFKNSLEVKEWFEQFKKK